MTAERRSTGAVVSVVVVVISAIVGPIVVYEVNHRNDPKPQKSAPAVVQPAPTTKAQPQTTPPEPDNTATRKIDTNKIESERTEKWIALANRYCDGFDARVKAAGQINSYEDVPVVAPKLAAVYRTMDAHLRSMAPPAAIREQVILMTQHWDTAAAALTDAVRYAAIGDAISVQSALSSSEASNQDGNSIAYSMGLSECADAGAP